MTALVKLRKLTVYKKIFPPVNFSVTRTVAPALAFEVKAQLWLGGSDRLLPILNLKQFSPLGTNIVCGSIT